MNREQLLMGGVTLVLCLLAWPKIDWFLREIPKGKWLVNKLGWQTAKRFTQIILCCFALLGLALAANLIPPMRW